MYKSRAKGQASDFRLFLGETWVRPCPLSRQAVLAFQTHQRAQTARGDVARVGRRRVVTTNPIASAVSTRPLESQGIQMDQLQNAILRAYKLTPNENSSPMWAEHTV